MPAKLLIVSSRIKSNRSRAFPGFTLVETVVSALLLALLVTATASFFTTATQATRKTGVASTVNSVIDSDLSQMKRLAEDYTCCDGSCSLDASKCTYDFETETSWHYFPNPNLDDSVNTARRAQFFNLCKEGLTSSLILDMQKYVPGNGIVKSVQKDNLQLDDHVIRINYRSGGIERISTLVPIVSAWCP